MVLKSFVNFLYNLACLKKEWTSVTAFGEGNFNITLTLPLSTSISLKDMTSPKQLQKLSWIDIFPNLEQVRFLFYISKMLSKLWRNLLKEFSNTVKSSINAFKQFSSM